VAAAYEELDAGELSFALAEPVSDSRDERGPDSWRPIELGQMQRGTSEGSPLSVRMDSLPIGAESKKPSTKDGPPPPRGGDAADGDASASVSHRHTLMVGVAPPHDPADAAMLGALPSPRPPSFVVDAAGAPMLRRSTAVRVPVVRVPGHSALPLDMGGFDPNEPPSKRTLPPPPPLRPPSAPPVVQGSTSTDPPPAAQLTRDSIVSFPASGNVVIHPSGVALVRTAAAGFAARLEALRASSNALSMKLLERQVKGKSTGESFGGVGSPLVHATGEGQLVLAPRAGRKLSSFKLGLTDSQTLGRTGTPESQLTDEMCFVREEVLLGFDGELAFENGRLATGEGEFVAVVQLRGKGVVLLEAIGEILTLEVHGNRGLSVRREVVLGWFGRLVPRALAPSEAPCGQRGLVSFAGEGRVLVASA